MTKKQILNVLFWSGVALLTVGVIWSVCAYPSILKERLNAKSIVGLGEYGDIYGGLNTLFTGLAFVGLVVTILLQRQEMKETREEFAAQTKQFEEQTHLLNEQIEEQKRANGKQFQLAIDAQHKEELFKRLNIIKELEANVIVGEVCVEFDGYTYHGGCKRLLNGEAALRLIFTYCSGFIDVINSEKELSEYLEEQIYHEQNAVEESFEKLHIWMSAVSDYIRDTYAYFSDTPENAATFCRLLTSIITPATCDVLLLFAGTSIPKESVLKAYNNKHILGKYIDDIRMNEKAKEIMHNFVGFEITVNEARAEWREYLRTSGEVFFTAEYRKRDV